MSGWGDAIPCLMANKKTAAKKAAKKPVARKAAKKGKRYTPAKKKKVVAYVNEVNAAKGRGGVAAAKKKFGITALTISKWVKDAGGAIKGAPRKAARGRPKVSRKPAASGRAKSLAQLTSLLKEIGQKKSELARLEAKFEQVKRSL